MSHQSSIESTLTRGERSAPFALSDEFERISGPTRLALDIEETDEEILFAETDPATGETIKVGDLANRRSKDDAGVCHVH
jgi:hypothetical protein